MPLTFIPSPTIQAEQALALYISGSLSGSVLMNTTGSGNGNVNIYTGIDNEDKYPPAIVVNCKMAQEVYFNTRVYAFDVDVTVKGIANDETIVSYQTLAGNVFAYFTDSVSASAAIAPFATPIGMNFWQVQIGHFEELHDGDAWIGTLNMKLIGALTPTS